MSANRRAKAKEIDDALAAMDAAHTGGHDPCDCLTGSERSDLERESRLLKLAADAIDNPAVLPPAPKERLFSKYKV